MQSVDAPRPVRAVPSTIAIRIELLGDLCLLHFKGRLHESPQSDYMKAKVEEIKASGCTKFLANLEGVTSLDCRGLSFIISLYKASGGRLVLVKARRQEQEVLDITRLSTVIPLAADIETGLAALCGEISTAGGAG